MIQTAIIFIWRNLVFLIHPLYFFKILYGFLMSILEFFITVFDDIIGYIRISVESPLTCQKLMDPNEGVWEKLKEIVKIIFVVTVGSSVIYFFKEVNNFLLNFFIKIGNLLLKILLRILSIILIILKIFYLILKNVIILLKFVLFFYSIFLFFHCENETKLG